MSFGLCNCVVRQQSTNVSKEYVTSIFKLGDKAKQESTKKQGVNNGLNSSLFISGLLLGLYFYREDEGDTFL
jgi:hypothetical protein